MYFKSISYLKWSLHLSRDIGVYLFQSLNDPDWWRIATVWALALKRHVRIFFAYKLIWVRNPLSGCCECTPLVLLDGTITSMVAVPLYAMTKLKLGAVCAGSHARVPWLITTASVTVLDRLIAIDWQLNNIYYLLTDAAAVICILAKWH